MTYLSLLNLKCCFIVICLVTLTSSKFTSPFNTPPSTNPPLFSGTEGDADNDGILDFYDMDSDNDGILDMDENVVCETVDLSQFNGETDALTTFNDANITVGGINGSVIKIDDPLELNGSAGIDEFIISNEHVLDSGSDSTSLLLGVEHAAGETGLANSLGTNYSFSKPVCNFNFKLYDIDRTDEVLVNGSLNGVPVPYTVVRKGVCLEYDEAASTFSSICDVQARPSNSNVFEHSADIVFDGCIDRLEFDLYDFAVGNGGSFTFLPAPDPVCVGLDTDSDGIPDFLDLDSDNDGIPDAIEACSELTLALEDCTLDNNNDGTYVMDAGVSTGELVDRCATSPVDTDSDGIPDFMDLDSDGDGCSDAMEAGTSTSNPNVTDSEISDAYASPAAAVNDCGLVLLADGATTECPTPAANNWVDMNINPCAGGISVVKTGVLDVGADGEPSEGDVINYTFEVCNTGMSELSMVMVTDPLITVAGGPVTLAGMMCDATSFTGTYMLTAADITNAMVMNTATAMGTDPGGAVFEAMDDENIPIVIPGSVSIVKTGTFTDENANGVADEGETITYTFEVTNSGPVDLTNVTVTDPVVTVSGGPVDLAAGAIDNSTFTATYTITAADLTNGMVANTATAAGVDPSGTTVMGESTEDIPLVTGTPEISLVKTGTFNDENGNGFAEIDETISYTFEVTNSGTLDLMNVTVTDPLVTVSGGPVTLTIAQVDNTSFTGTYTITAADLVNGNVINTATAAGTDPGGTTVTDDSMADVMTVAGVASISIVKEGMLIDSNGDGYAQAGEIISYTFTVTNDGDLELMNIAVTDPIITVTGGPIGLTAGQIDASSFSGSYTVTQADVDAGTLLNTATVNGVDISNNPVTNDSDEETLLPQNPAIMIVKTGVLNDENDNGISDVGETISYVFIVTNVGNTTLTGVIVDDPLVDVTGAPMTLAPMDVDNSSYSGIYMLTQADIDAGVVNNVATVDATDPNSANVSDSDDEQTPLVQSPKILVLKSGVFQDEDGDGFANVGETISYTFVVMNTGNVSLTNVTINDPLITVIGGPIPVFAPGETNSDTFTGTYAFTQADIDSGLFENIAIASGFDPSGAPVEDDSDDPQNPANIDPDGDGDPDDPTVVPAIQNPKISLLKTGTFVDGNGDGYAQPGETITYEFTVTNTGNVTLTDITVTDDLVTVMGTPIPSLSPGESNSTNFSASITITQADIDSGGIENSALATGTDPNGGQVNDVSDDPQNPENIDPNGDGDPDDPTFSNVPLNPMISVLKTGTFQDENGDDFAQPGETLSYTFVVTNTGNVTLTDVVITDELATVSGNVVPVLAPGESNTSNFTAVYSLTQADIDAGLVENTALATGTDPDGNPVTDTSDDPQNPADIDPDGDGDPDDPTVISTPQNPMIAILKEGRFVDENGDGFAQPGETMIYGFTITNTGNVTLSNVTVADDIVTVAGAPIASLAPGETNTMNFTASYSITQADIDAGSIENLAIASGVDPNGDTVTDTSDDPQNPANVDPDGDGNPDDPTIISTPQNPRISILKTGSFVDGDGDGFAQPGETITYEFTITNIGNVTLTDVTVTDNLVTVMGTAIPSLSPGQSDATSFTATYTLTQADIDAGGIENSAITTGTDPNGDTVSDRSDDPQDLEDVDPNGDGDPDDPTFTTVPLNPMIFVIKTGTFIDEDGDGFSQPGETILYTFTVTNTGNVTLRDIVITDDLATVGGFPISSLAPGESNSSNFTASYTITQQDIDSGSFENSALATGIDPSGNPVTDISDDPQNPTDIDPDGDGDPDDPTVTDLPQNPDISILKIGTFNDENGDGFGQPGETISYVFVLTNTGNVTLTNVTVNDPKVTVVGGPIASFAPGAVDNITFSGAYTITQFDIDMGVIDNLAIATGTDPNGAMVEDESDDPQNPEDADPDGDGDPDDPTLIPVGQNPTVEIFKSGTFNDTNGNGYADIGENISYEFVVVNTGNVTLRNIVIEDESIIVSGGTISILLPGESSDALTGTFILTEADLSSLSYTNSATAIGQDPNGEAVTDISDDPNDPTDIDVEGDGEPDDPTVVPYCGILLDNVRAAPFQCLSSLPLDADSDGSGLSPTTYETIYILTSQPNGVIEQISTMANNFVVNKTGVYTIHTFIAELDSPDDPHFFDLSMIAFGDTRIREVYDFIIDEALCADLNFDGTTINVARCNVNLLKEQVDEEIFDDEDVALTFKLTITNNGDYDLIDLDLTDDLVFLPVTDPVSPLNEMNMEVSITNVNSTELPILNPGYNGTTDLDLLDGMSGFLKPGESFIIVFKTEASVFKFRQAFNIFQTNQAYISGTHIDPNGDFVDNVNDISDDPTVFTEIDVDGDGDPDDPTPIQIPVCDELVCNNDLIISLNSDCYLEVTPDMLLENPSPLGLYTIEFYNPSGEPIGNILTEEFVFVQLLFNLDCSQGSCWGHATIEANQIPQFDAPCQPNENGVIPDDCIIWCDPGYYPSIIVTPQEVEDAFGDCGPSLINLFVEEERTGDICDENGEIVTLKYTGKVERHGRIETLDILTQTYAIQKINIDIDNNGINAVFSFPEDVIIDCDSQPEENIDPSIELYSPEYLSYLIDGFDAFPFYYNIHEIIADTIITADTTQVLDETKFTLRDTMVKQDIDGDNILDWVVITLVDKPLVDLITYDTIIDNFAHPKVPVFNINCNTASSYSDIEFEACGSGRKIVRTWTILDWCDSNIFISGKQTIEIRDLSPPQLVVENDGELIPVTMLDDVIVNIEPFTCSAIFKLPELQIIDNCDQETTIEWIPDEGVVGSDFITDLWYEQSPIHVTGFIYDDCENVTEFSFNIIIQDDTPPVAICETSLNISLTHNQLEQDGFAKVYATDIDEGSHDSDCGKVKLSVVRLEDWSEVQRDCQDRIVGYKAKSCHPLTNDIDLGEPIKNDCELTGDNIGKITVPGDHVKFCCEDVGKSIAVILIVEDEEGNTNQCITYVQVDDRSVPSILCSDQVVSCNDGDQLLIPAMLGASCPRENTLEVELIGESRSNNVCSGGQVVREWFIDIDRSGDFSTGDPYCTQIVSVASNDSFDPYTIKWPKYYNNESISGVNVECDDGEVVENPATVTMGAYSTCVPDDVIDLPVWCDTNCGLVGYSMDSDTIIASDACLKIIRRWTIVDWCLYNPNSSTPEDGNDTSNDSFIAVEDWAQGVCASCPDYGPVASDAVYFRYDKVEKDGYYTFDQVIVVNDDSSPEITADAIYEVSTSGGIAKGDQAAGGSNQNLACVGSAVVTATASDFCDGDMTGANHLLWQIILRDGNDILATTTARGPEGSIETPEAGPGTRYEIEWIVKDGCGNQASTTTQLRYIDRTAPTPFCVSGLTTSFNTSDGSVVIWASEFDFGSTDNCTPTEDLRFSIMTPGDTAIDPSDAAFSSQSSIEVSCNNASNFTDLRVWVWDTDGNGDFCDVGIIVDRPCEELPEDDGIDDNVGSSLLIEGQVSMYDGQTMRDVDVTISSNLAEFPKRLTTGNSGRFRFNDLVADFNYELDADKDDSYINGVSTLDLIGIQQHIVGKKEFENPYVVIAADANRDSKVTALDILQLRRLILGLTDNLPESNTWTFVDAADEFFDATNPWPFTESIAVSALQNSMSDANFIGIKIGDVNHTATVNGVINASTRSSQTLSLRAIDRDVQRGDLVTVDLTSSALKRLQGFQFTLDHSGLDLISVKSNVLDIAQDNYGKFLNQTSISWSADTALEVDDQTVETILSFTFLATQHVNLSDALSINSSITKKEAYYNGDSGIADINLNFNGAEGMPFTIEQNKPNPFSTQTIIGITLPSSGTVNLKVLDLTGRTLVNKTQDYSTGYHEYEVSADHLNQNGVYYYQVSFNGEVKTKKMILLK